MTDTTYTTKTEQYFEGRREEMLPFIPIAAKRMLEVGCGNAAFAAHLKSQRQIDVTVIESYAAAAAVARPRVDRLLQTSIEEALPQLAGEQFDCIVMNDVLEHLNDPWAVLQDLAPLLGQGGCVVASIPNVRYVPVFKEYVLEGQWRYRQHGVMDRTHVRFFTQSSIKDMFESTGYVVDRIDGINSMPLPWKFGLLNLLTGQALADTRFQQFACVARRRS